MQEIRVLRLVPQRQILRTCRFTDKVHYNSLWGWILECEFYFIVLTLGPLTGSFAPAPSQLGRRLLGHRLIADPSELRVLPQAIPHVPTRISLLKQKETSY